MGVNYLTLNFVSTFLLIIVKFWYEYLTEISNNMCASLLSKFVRDIIFFESKRSHLLANETIYIICIVYESNIKHIYK